ncbi:MAG: hypothetical protein Kow0042_09420 [Calditrichia bacterium]
MNKDVPVVIADGHVHIHDCFDLNTFFRAARENFSRLARQAGAGESFIGVLFLTEAHGVDYYSRFHQVAEKGYSESNSLLKNFIIRKTNERCSLRILSENEEELILIAGRQIVSGEKLEVLALGIPEHFGEGWPAEKIIAEVNSRERIAVIPWGMGKWLGERGEIVKKILTESPSGKFYLGDNGNRLALWPRPPLFTLAEELGIRILPGSDPLPFPSECKKVGAYGFVLKDCETSDRPFEALKQRLASSPDSIQTVGGLETPFRFFKNQVAMQFYKRKNKSITEAK